MEDRYVNERIEKAVVEKVLAPLREKWHSRSFSRVILRLWIEWYWYRANFGDVPKDYLKVEHEIIKPKK